MTDTITDKSSARFACPRCRKSGLERTSDSAICPDCDAEYVRRGGVWNFLPADRSAYFASFLDSYTRIRTAEGRVSDDSAEYRGLPCCRADHPLARQWRIRRRSFEALMRLLKARLAPGSTILDLGAGVGWLSNRLHESGYVPLAVDLSDDNGDGLGAARHYNGDWLRIVAEFDRLPFADRQADGAIFNSSFHYSTDYAGTLRETMRVVRAGGLIVILDSPVYRDPASGTRMLQEQHDSFEAQFGDRSDSIPISGFLTWDALSELADELGLAWQRRTPWYGWRWVLRPYLARARGQREPGRFALIWSSRP